MEKHTRLPWFIEKDGVGRGNIYSDIGRVDLQICKIHKIPAAEANAEFIVRACNNHQKLVDACKRAQTRLSELGQNESCRTNKVLAASIAEAEKETK